MKMGQKNYAHGEPALSNTNEAQFAIKKIQDEVQRIQSMITDMEQKAKMSPAQRNALLSVVEKEKRNLVEKRTELTQMLLQREERGDAKYLVKQPEEELSVPPVSDEEAFDSALRGTGESQAADRIQARERNYQNTQEGNNL